MTEILPTETLADQLRAWHGVGSDLAYLAWEEITRLEGRVEELEALLLKAARNGLGTGWRPIETAPRSGVAVLLWQPWKSGRSCMVIGHYANGWVDRNCVDFLPEPTHWMPLPQEPTS